MTSDKSRHLLFVDLAVEVCGSLLHFLDPPGQPPSSGIDPGLAMLHVCDQFVWTAIFAIRHRSYKMLVRIHDGFRSLQFDTFDPDRGLIAYRQNPIGIALHPRFDLLPV